VTAKKHAVRVMIGGEYTVRSDLTPSTRAKSQPMSTRP
jgi:hypothetical protein